MVKIRIRVRINFIAIRTQGFYEAHNGIYNKQWYYVVKNAMYKINRKRERREYTTANNVTIRCQTLCTKLTEGRERHESARAASPPPPPPPPTPLLVASGACSGRLAAPLWSRCPSMISLTLGSASPSHTRGVRRGSDQGQYAPQGSTPLLPRLSVTSKVSARTSYAWVGSLVHFRSSEDVTLLEFTSPIDRE